MAMYASRLLMMATLAGALAASGCIVANQAGKGTLGNGGTISNSIRGTNLSASTIRGEVRLPASHLPASYRTSAITNDMPAVKAEVTLRDYKMAQVPNAPTVKSDGNGKFALNKVPADHVWVVTAEHSKGLAASLVFVEPKRTANTKLTLGSTLALAAIQPLFMPDPSTKDAVQLDELNMALFQKLVDAIEAVLTNETLIPAETTLKAYRKHFKGLNSGAVLTAYNAVVDDLKKKGSVNTNPATNGTGGTGGETGPEDEATDAMEPATDAVEPGSGENPASDPVTVDPELYKPLIGTVSEVANLTIQTSDAIQMAALEMMGASVLLIPDGNRVHTFLSATSEPETYTAESMGVSFTEAKALTVDGTKAYTVGKVDGVPNLIVLEPDGDMTAPTKMKATAKPLSGEMIGQISGLVYSSEKTALVGVDEGRHTIVTIKEGEATAEVAVYAGTPGKNEADPVPADTVGTILFNQPSSIAKQGTKIYVTDTEKHRIVEVDLTTDKVKVVSGSSQDPKLLNGPTKLARYTKPYGIFLNKDGAFVIADRNNEALRLMNVTADTVVSYVDQKVTGSDAQGYKMIAYPRGVAEYGGKVFAINNIGKVKTWTKD